MAKAEQERFVGYTERPLNRAGWLAQEIAKRRDIEKGSIRVFVNLENPNLEVISARMEVPSWPSSKSRGVVVDVSCSHFIDLDKPSWEAINVAIRLPEKLQDEDFPCFFDEAIEGWHRWVDKELLPRAHPVNWRVLPRLTDEKQTKIWLDDQNTATDEEEQITHLTFEEVWDLPYSSRNFGNLTKQQFANSVFDAFSHSYSVAIASFESFVRTELPKLIREREKRVKSKKPEWLYEAMTRRKDIKVTGHGWEIPETGVEPDTCGIALEINIPGKTKYEVTIVNKNLKDCPDLSIMESFILLPNKTLSTSMTRNDLDNFTRAFFSFLKEGGNLKKMVVFDLEKTGVFKYFRLAGITTQRGIRPCLHFKLHGDLLSKLQKAGINNERIVNQIIDTLISLHPYLQKFLEG